MGNDAATIFSLAVENCCGGRWLTTRTEELAVGISRTHIACSGCGQRRILTVTNRPAPHGLEVVA